MDMGLEGRTAIVCGASSGMGLATAEALAAEGANVVMFGRRRELLEREADRVGALAVQGDLTIPQHLERLVQATVGAFGGVDVLVLNGGGPPAGKESTIRYTEPAIGHDGLYVTAVEAARRITAGETGTPLRPLTDSVATLRLVDAIRRQIGVTFREEIAAGIPR